MNQTLKHALSEVETLSEAEQEELGQALLDMALRKKIDARLRAAREKGGAMPARDFQAELRARYAD